MKKQSSLKKIETNIRNSRKSTGPKTKKGKSISKRNALKHGILSREIVLSDGDGKEKQAEYDIILSGLQNQFQPIGIIEEMLVEKIAINYWRLHRVLKYENGEIQKRLQSAIWELVFKRVDSFNSDKKFMILDQSRDNMYKSTIGLQYIIKTLQDIRLGVEIEGYLGEREIGKIFEIYGHDEDTIGYMLLVLNFMITKDREVDEKYSGSPDEIPDSETAQKKLLCMIDKEIKTWKGMIKEFDKKEKMELNAEVDSLFIPSKEALDKIIRYETAIEKQFYRALHELIRLQAFRKGQNIQVPLAVDLDISTDS